MESLLPLAKRVGEKLKARKETIGVSESSSGGLVSAVLLAVPGASAYFMGGAVVYTRPAGEAFLTATPSKRAGIRSSSEPWALLAAELVRGQLNTTWGLAETGAAGPDRQFLRRSRRPHLRRRGRPQGQGRAHAAHRLDRSRRQHAGVRRRSAQAAGRAALVEMRWPDVFLVNGPSSAGKTTLCRALQAAIYGILPRRRLRRFHLHVGAPLLSRRRHRTAERARRASRRSARKW